MNTGSNIVASDFPPETEPRKSVASWYTPGHSDGLGDRLLMFDNTSGSSLELLRFKREFASRPQFEDALRRRVADLQGFEHPALARVRAVEWLGIDDGLALVSNQTTGRRLSELFQEARGQKFALELLRQLMPVLAALQKRGHGMAHGLVTPDRIIVAPGGQLVLIEHVLGSAIESLNLPAERLRREFGLPVPIDAGRRRSSGVGVPFDQRTDVLQLGFLALSVLAGRDVQPGDYPGRSAALLEELAENGDTSVPPPLLTWLQRALQLDEHAFVCAEEAHEALEGVSEIPPRRIEPPRATFDVVRPAAALEAPVSHEERHDMKRGSDLVSEYLETAAPRPAAPPRAALPEPRVTPRFTPRPAAPPPQLPAPPPPPARRYVGWVVAALSVAVIAEAAVIVRMVYTRRVQPPASVAAAPKPPAPSALPADVPPSATKSDAVLQTVTAAASSAVHADTPGRLEITSEPAGARVSVDGTRRGVTSLVVPLAPGAHTVVISDGNGSSTRTVNVAAGSVATLMAAMPAGAAAGWVTMTSPVDLQVREGGSLLGITSADRLMLPAGHHELVLSSAPLGFQTTLPVDVQAGRTISVAVRIPNGSVSINALPWANVWLDGQSLGTTPLANMEVALGSHEVIWRHPQMGERRQTIIVTAKSPLRVVMDFSK